MLQTFTDLQRRPGYPTRTIAIGLGAMIVLLFLSTLLTWQVVNKVRGVTETQIAVLTATEQVAALWHGPGAVDQVRGRAWRCRRRQSLSHHSAAIAHHADGFAQRVHLDDNVRAAAEVDRADLALIAMEYRALELVSNGEIERARRIIRSDRV